MNSKRIFYYCLWYGIAFLFAAYSWMTFRVFFASSELWSVNLGFHFWQEIQHSWVYSRLAFYLPLNLVQSFTEDPVTNLYAVRALMLVWTGVLIFSIHRFLKKFHADSNEDSQWSLALVLGLILSHTTFLNQGFRIRSDFFATVFALWSLTYFMFDSKKSIVKDLFFFLLPVLATPKAIVYVIGLLVFRPWQRLWHHPLGKWFLLFGAFIVSVIFSILNQDSLLFLKNAIFEHGGSPDYFSQQSFFHIFKSLKYNPLFYLLLARVTYLNVVQLMDRGFQNLSSWLQFEIFCLVITFLLLLQPEKVPYLIASLLPFWAIWMHPWILNHVRELSWKKWIFGFVVMLTLFTFSTHWTIRNLDENFNAYQLEMIGELNEYMQANSFDNYLDGVGVVPSKDRYRVFLGPNSFESALTIERLVADAVPDLILMTSEMVPLETVQNRLLNEKYMNMQQGIFLRAHNLSKMTADQVEKLISENQKNRPEDSLVMVEILTKRTDLYEENQRIKLTMAELLRKYNSIIKSKRPGKIGSVRIGKVCFFPELKVSMRDSLRSLFKIDVYF